MFPQSGVSSSTGRTGIGGANSVVRVDIRQFPWIKRLAADYVFDYSKLAEFFAGDPAQPAAWRDAIGRTQRRSKARPN